MGYELTVPLGGSPFGDHGWRDMHPWGHESLVASARRSLKLTYVRARGCALARNESSETAVLSVPHISSRPQGMSSAG